MSGYPPGTPMLREELSQGSLRPNKRDKKAQYKLENLRRDLIDILGRVTTYGDPLASEERIRLIDMNVHLAKKRSDAARAATEAARVKAEAAKAAARKNINYSKPYSKSYTIGGVPSPSPFDTKEKQKEVAKDDDAVTCIDDSEDSECSMANTDFEAALAPYIKETLQSSLISRVQLINADCAAKGLPPPARQFVIHEAITELRGRIDDGNEEDDDRFVTEIALKILDEFSIASRPKGNAFAQ